VPWWSLALTGVFESPSNQQGQMLTYKSTLVKTKLYYIVHQQSCPLLYVLSFPLVHPNSGLGLNTVPTTVLSASASQRLARSQSCSWIHRPQIRIISSWSWNLEDMKWRIMNWSMSIHTYNIASVIPVSTTPSATSITPIVSASIHTKTQRICEQKKLLIICTQLHSVAQLQSDIVTCWCFT